MDATRRRGSGGLRRDGFTLIEVLVVIAVIALLLSILLPSIGKSRDGARSLRCMINCKQIITAAHVYANDYKEQVWTAWNWADADPGVGFMPGLLFDYVDYADFIVECPTNKRQRVGSGGNGTNGFGWNRDLNFDYTMFDELQGVHISRPIACAYVRASDATPPNLPVSLVPFLKRFPAAPLFIEESTPIWNQVYTDGWWGNQDQVTLRHDKGGHLALLDGQVVHFRQKKGNVEEVRQPGQDFEANHVYISTKQRANSWWKVTDRNQPYGWANNPR